MQNFLENANATNHASITILYRFFFNNFTTIDFNVFKNENDFLKEKLCSLFKKDPHDDSESTENKKPMNKQ
jgi:hypothetical protein